MKFPFLLIAFCFAAFFAFSPAYSAKLPLNYVMTARRDQVEAQLPNEEPALYYVYAGRLFQEGRREDAVLWFYIGQLRFHIKLKANPGRDPSKALALFTDLQEEYAPLINGWAAGDVKMWTAQIDRALAWDLSHENGITSKKKFRRVYNKERALLAGARAEIAETADQIRQQRKELRMENRSSEAPDPAPTVDRKEKRSNHAS